VLDYGTDITSYTIMVQADDSEFYADSVNCDGANPAIIAAA